jgi:hypothetical protein
MAESQRERWSVAYVRRALPAFPAAVDAQHLAATVDAAAKLLPVGSMVPVLMAQHITARCSELLQQEGAPQSTVTKHGSPQALQLVQLLAHMLLVVDLHVLPGVMDAAESAALAAPQAPLRHEVRCHSAPRIDRTEAPISLTKPAFDMQTACHIPLFLASAGLCCHVRCAGRQR